MATNRSGHRPGGGIASRQHVEKPVRTGKGSRGISEGWVGQKGQMQGDQTTDSGATGYRGEPKFTGKNFNPTPYGNEVAAKTVCGPGGSRKVYGSGSQQQWGDVAGSERPVGRDILNNE